MKIDGSPTRCPHLNIWKQAPGLWRFVTTESNSVVGSQYRTKFEIYADLARYAEEYCGKDWESA